MIKILETERLILRVPTLDDAQDSFEIYGDRDVMLYVDGSEPYKDVERAKLSIQRGLDYYEKHGLCHFATVEKKSNKMIGHCGFNLYEDTADPELVIHINKKYWGQGFGSEAGTALMKYAIHELKANRIVGLADNENIASQKIMEKIGMAYVEDMFLEGYLLKLYELKSG